MQTAARRGTARAKRQSAMSVETYIVPRPKIGVAVRPASAKNPERSSRKRRRAAKAMTSPMPSPIATEGRRAACSVTPKRRVETPRRSMTRGGMSEYDQSRCVEHSQ